MAHLNLGQLLASRGRCEEAAAILRRCSQLDSTGLKDPKQHETTRISALLHLGRLFADQGRYHKAVSVYLEAVNAMPHFYQPQVSKKNWKFLQLKTDRKKVLTKEVFFSLLLLRSIASADVSHIFFNFSPSRTTD